MEILAQAPRPVNTGELTAVHVPNSVEDPRFPKVVDRTREPETVSLAATVVSTRHGLTIVAIVEGVGELNRLDRVDVISATAMSGRE